MSARRLVKKIHLTVGHRQEYKVASWFVISGFPVRHVRVISARWWRVSLSPLCDDAGPTPHDDVLLQTG